MLQKQAAAAVDNSRLKSEFLGYSWHTVCDKNSIIYGVVTERDYPDDVAPTFLRQITSLLYESCAELRKDPQSIETAQAFSTRASDLKMLIYEVHSRFKDPRSLDKTTHALAAIDKATG